MDLHKPLGAWDTWLTSHIASLQEAKLLRSLRPLVLTPAEGCAAPGGAWPGPYFPARSSDRDPEGAPPGSCAVGAPTIWRQAVSCPSGGGQMAAPEGPGPGPWDRRAVEVRVSEVTYSEWLEDRDSTGCDSAAAAAAVAPGDEDGAGGGAPPAATWRVLTLFSGNDYLGLASHPAVRAAAAEAALEYGMGPRSSPLVCGYTAHHRRLESSLAALKHTEECLLTPTGFAANMAVIAALGGPDLAGSGRPPPGEGGQLDIFSDSLNHASIIDGLRLVRRTGGGARVRTYRHCDMGHLKELLSQSTAARKAVITDSLFSMDGDFAPMTELAALRRTHGFLWVVDEVLMGGTGIRLPPA